MLTLKNITFLIYRILYGSLQGAFSVPSVNRKVGRENSEHESKTKLVTTKTRHKILNQNHKTTLSQIRTQAPTLLPGRDAPE